MAGYTIIRVGSGERAGTVLRVLSADKGTTVQTPAGSFSLAPESFDGQMLTGMNGHFPIYEHLGPNNPIRVGIAPKDVIFSYSEKRPPRPPSPLSKLLNEFFQARKPQPAQDDMDLGYPRS